MIPVVLYEGVSSFEALVAFAALRAGGVDPELVGTEAVIRTREGPRLLPDRLGFGAIAQADVAVVPGGDVTHALRDAELTAALRARRGRWTLSSGDAILLAARAGLADGRRIARPMSGAAIPEADEVSRARLVADGRFLTCCGEDAIADLALHYVAHARGPDTASAAAAMLGRAHHPFALGATESGA